MCGNLVPCASYFNEYPFETILEIDYSFTFTLVSGYNKLYLSKQVQVKKGSFIYLIQSNANIAIDQTNTATMYSDLFWNNKTKWTKLNDQSNWRFYLSSITSFNSYFTSFNISHKYSNTGLYNLTITFLSSNKIFQQIINITDCKLNINFIIMLKIF